uniref:Uncharacterized protein n=1 Tax=Ditylum brightwellii TaxID=49249 RepID=A0A6U3XCR5_9STRA|mmetsp:Transcript_13659/g.20393  ORF Transcript_13659/g.20393 Transcript_13659/m.20393 type:complete len:481 (+) Transcript_13659:164-1606(+)
MASFPDPASLLENRSVSLPSANCAMTKDNNLPYESSADDDQPEAMPPARKAQYSRRNSFCVKPSTNILEGSYSPSELSMSEMLDKEFPWVDAYNASGNQDSEDCKDVDMEEVYEMLRTHSIAELRQKLIIVQQQLYTHYDLVDKYEQCNAKMSKVEEENGKVLAEKKKYEMWIKKLRLRSKQQKADMSLMEKQLADVKTELAQTKLQLAQAKTQQEHSDALLKSISDTKDSLVPTNAQQPTTEQNETMPRRKCRRVSILHTSESVKEIDSHSRNFTEEKDRQKEESASACSSSYCANSPNHIKPVTNTDERANIQSNPSCLSSSGTNISIRNTTFEKDIPKIESVVLSSSPLERLIPYSTTGGNQMLSHRNSWSPSLKRRRVYASSANKAKKEIDSHSRNFTEEKDRRREESESACSSYCTNSPNQFESVTNTNEQVNIRSTRLCLSSSSTISLDALISLSTTGENQMLSHRNSWLRSRH